MRRWVGLLSGALMLAGPANAQTEPLFEAGFGGLHDYEAAVAWGANTNAPFRLEPKVGDDGRVVYFMYRVQMEREYAEGVCARYRANGGQACVISGQPPMWGDGAPLPGSFQVVMAGLPTFGEARAYGASKRRPFYVGFTTIDGVTGHNATFTGFATRDEAVAFCEPLPEICRIVATRDAVLHPPGHTFTVAAAPAPPAITGVDVTQLFLCQSTFDAARAAARRLRVVSEDEDAMKRTFAVGNLLILGHRPITALQDTGWEDPDDPGFVPDQQTYQVEFALYRSELLELIRARGIRGECDPYYIDRGGCRLAIVGYDTRAETVRTYGRYRETGSYSADILVAGTEPGDDRRVSGIKCDRERRDP